MKSKVIQNTIRMLLLLIIEFIVFTRFGKFASIIGLLIIIYKVLNMFGFIQRAEVNKMSFPMGIYYKKDYLNDYSKNGKFYDEVFDLCEKDSKKRTKLVAFYYDNPQTTPKDQCRASIGLFFRKAKNDEELDPEFEKQILNAGYKKQLMESAQALMVEWYYETFMGLLIGIDKAFYAITKIINDLPSLKQYRFNEKPKNFVGIEYYETDDKLFFYVPMENTEQFLIYDQKNEIKGNEGEKPKQE